MNNYKYIMFIEYKNLLYKYGEIKIKHDGSIYLLLPGNSKAKTGHNDLRKISVHSSGQINYETPDFHKVYISPLYSNIKPTPIIGVYLPNLKCLDVVEKKNFIINSIILNIDFSENILVNFVLSCNNDLVETKNTFFINVTSNLYINVALNYGKYDNKCKNKVRWYYLEKGDHNKLVINKFQAKQLFYDVLYKNSDFKIIGPDENGKIELCFETVMHDVPLLKLELADPNQYVVPIKGSRIHLEFMIKNKKRGDSIVKKSKYIKIKNVMVSCEPFIEETEEGKTMIKFDKIWK